MNPFTKIYLWGKYHHPLWVEGCRIFLGLILIVKGYYFVHNDTLLLSLSNNPAFGQLSTTVAYVVPFVNIIGGVFLVVGLITRIALLCELPVLIGAVFFVNLHNAGSAGNAELYFSLLVLLLIIFFLIEGPGVISLDHHIMAGKRRDRRDKIRKEHMLTKFTHSHSSN